jgi:type IV secretory pathway VirB4 component
MELPDDPDPEGVEHVSMTAGGSSSPRLPIGAGRHVVLFGATGAGKTTTARRLITARTLDQHAALFVLDQKGDDDDVDGCVTFRRSRACRS